MFMNDTESPRENTCKRQTLDHQASEEEELFNVGKTDGCHQLGGFSTCPLRCLDLAHHVLTSSQLPSLAKPRPHLCSLFI